MSQEGPVRVLIVDDSALMRNLVGRIIEADPLLTVAGKAMNGAFALQKIERTSPDLIVLDIEMPEMNGLEFLKERRRLGIDIPVVVLSSQARKGAQITMDCLSLGAADFILKPSGPVSSDIHLVAHQLQEMARGYGSHYRSRRGLLTAPKQPESAQGVAVAPVFAPPGGPPSVPPVTARPEAQPARPAIIALGISTGGPNALRKLFAAIPAHLDVPVVVVQHMPAGFTSEFAKSLDRICPLEVKEAEDGDVLKPGRILIAPGDHHISVERRSLAGIAKVFQSPHRNGHRPSADVLFASVAEQYRNASLGVIMTGMGRDGAEELGSIYRRGGMTIGQDEASSVVYGMPRVAFEMGVVHRQVSLSGMADAIAEAVFSFDHESDTSHAPR